MTMTDRSTVVGVFEIRSEADAAIHELQRAGFSDDQIGFIVPGSEAAADAEEEHKSEVGDGAATGAVSGGVIGGVIGAAAALLIPGFGPAIAGGILITTLGGVAIGAAAGGILGALIGLGIPEEEARYYEGEFTTGRTIVTVRANGRQQEATAILHRNGGYDAGTRFAQAATASAQHPQAQAPTGASDTGEGYPEASAPDINVGAFTPDTQKQVDQPVAANATTSPREYNPVGGVTQTAQNASVKASGYGLQRDPAVETDATAGTYDTNERPATVAEDGSNDSAFERPVEPGTVEQGSWNDPNDRMPRVP